MSNPFNNPATMLEIIGNRMLITVIGKVLIKNNAFSASEVASELSGTIQALEASGGDPMLIAELKTILGAVVTW